MYDILIKNGLVVDGTGKKAFPADVAITKDKIVSIGDLKQETAKKIIYAAGKAVSPGFIDFHTHSDYTILFDQRCCSRIRAGITTSVIGNCGIGVAPIADAHKEELIHYLSTRIVGSIHAPLFLNWNTFSEYFAYIEKDPPATNIASYLAQGPIRINQMGFRSGPAAPEELEAMKKEVVQAMEEGAIGLSTGLVYMPGAYTEKEELAELCKAMAPYGGYYCTHMRDEGDGLLEAIDEAIYIAKTGGVPLHISHLKNKGGKNLGNAKKAFEKIHQAQAEGLEITYDTYPYAASMTSLGAFMPPWMFEGGVDEMMKRLKSRELRDKARYDMEHGGIKGWSNFYLTVGNWENVLMASVGSEKNKWMEGKDIASLAKQEGKDTFEFCFDLLIEEEGKIQVIPFVMNQSEVDDIVLDPDTIIDSDSADFANDGILNYGKPHPRAYGTTGILFRRYVRELGALSLEDAVKKLTSLPAKRMGFGMERGILAEGYYADIVIFDPETIADQADYVNPRRYTTGIDTVIVNGQIAMEHGEQLESVHAGRVLRRKNTKDTSNRKDDLHV